MQDGRETGKKFKGNLGQIEVNKLNTTKMWACKLKQLLAGNMDVFGYFSKYYSGHPPSDARELLKFAEEPDDD